MLLLFMTNSAAGVSHHSLTRGDGKVEDEETPTTDSGKKTVVSFPKKSRRPAPAAPAAPEAPAPSPTVNPEVVAYLTTLLARAKRGEIQAFGFASVDHEHVVRHSLYVGSGEYQNGLVAAVAYLSHELVAQNLSEDEEDEED
jgi:hypothetical protein